MSEPKTLSRHWQGPQSWEYEELLEIGEHKLRVRIDSDSFDFPSSAVCERWDGSAWRQVSSIPSQLMESRHGGKQRPVSFVNRSLTSEAREAYDSDRNKLVAEARMVLDTSDF